MVTTQYDPAGQDPAGQDPAGHDPSGFDPSHSGPPPYEPDGAAATPAPVTAIDNLEQVRAPLVLRALANVTDLIVVAAVVGIFVIIDLIPQLGLTWVFAGIGVLVAAVGGVVMRSVLGQSPGQMVAQLAVVDTRTGGHPSLLKSAIRTAVFVILSPLAYLPGWLVLFDKSATRGGLHGRASATTVVDATTPLRINEEFRLSSAQQVDQPAVTFAADHAPTDDPAFAATIEQIPSGGFYAQPAAPAPSDVQTAAFAAGPAAPPLPGDAVTTAFESARPTPSEERTAAIPTYTPPATPQPRAPEPAPPPLAPADDSANDNSPIARIPAPLPTDDPPATRPVPPPPVPAPGARTSGGTRPTTPTQRPTSQPATNFAGGELPAEGAPRSQYARTFGKTAPIVLWFDDGRRVDVTGESLLGREPADDAHAAVRVVLTDDTASVSKTHLRFGVIRNELWVEDVGSTNGSAIAYRDTWTELKVGERYIVEQGSVVHMGQRSFKVTAG